ncbi:11096_t:CDS:2, partial [Scutellospora calospora]
KTNNLGLELYILHAEINGSGYLIVYLFLESNSKSGNGIRTDTILTFLNEIKLQGLMPEFVLTDKDFVQISAIPLNKFPLQVTYKHSNAYEYFSFIKKDFVPQFPVQKGTIFCPKELYISVWELIDKHLYLHPLIPTSNLKLTCLQIWEQAALWMRAGCENKVSVLKTTMFIESHWKDTSNNYQDTGNNDQNTSNNNQNTSNNDQNINDNNQIENSNVFFDQLIDTIQKALDLLYEYKDTKNIK